MSPNNRQSKDGLKPSISRIAAFLFINLFFACNQNITTTKLGSRTDTVVTSATIDSMSQSQKHLQKDDFWCLKYEKRYVELILGQDGRVMFVPYWSSTLPAFTLIPFNYRNPVGGGPFYKYEFPELVPDKPCALESPEEKYVVGSMVIKISALKKLVDFAPDGEYDHLVFTPEFDDDYPRHVRYRIDLDSEAIKKAKAKGLRYDPAYANPSPPRKPQD